MTSSQLKEKSVEELQQAILQKCKELFKIRMQCFAGVEQKTHQLKEHRRAIARMKTILGEIKHNAKS